ncbi:MAG TPA: hypothetical protein VFF13_03890 [archaeon]|nr:hypothetical protein [archaeon]
MPIRKPPEHRPSVKIERLVLENRFFISNNVSVKALSDRVLEALHIPEASGKNQCAKYTRIAAERVFGLHYYPADANEVGKKNKIVWDISRKEKIPSIKPGQILGIYLPKSPFLDKGWRFTHTALVVGRQGSEYIIAHNIGGKLLIELLSSAISENNGRVMQVVEPKYLPGITPDYVKIEEKQIREMAESLAKKDVKVKRKGRLRSRSKPKKQYNNFNLPL